MGNCFITPGLSSQQCQIGLQQIILEYISQLWIANWKRIIYTYLPLNIQNRLMETLIRAKSSRIIRAEDMIRSRQI